MNEIPERTRLLRNLKDAGFDEATIQKYMELQKEAGGRSNTDYCIAQSGTLGSGSY